MRRWNVVLLVALLAAVPPGCRGALSRQAGRLAHPSVVLITFDTMRASYLGCYGDRITRTPTLDGLAAKGARFEQARATATFTPPSTWTILFSEQVHNHTYSTVLKDTYGKRGSLADRFRKAGYVTAGVVGSCILNASAGYGQGFDHYFDTFSELSFNNETTLARVLEVVHGPLEDPGRRKPFFLYVHFFDPHSPWGDAPASFRTYKPEDGPFPESARRHQMFHRPNDFETARIDNAVRAYTGVLDVESLKKTGEYERVLIPSYRSEITWADDTLRRLLDELTRGGLMDDTVLAVSSDHGMGFGEHYQTWGYVFPLFDEALRVPLVITGPGIEPRKVPAPVSLLDLGPTLLDLAGVADRHAEGVSFKAALSGGDVSRGTYAEATAMPPELEFMIVGDDRSRFATGAENIHSALVEGRHKLVHMPARRGEKFELFDLEKDPGEAVDLYSPADPGHVAMAGRLLSREKRGSQEPRAGIDPETAERLRALGYLK